MYSMLDCHSFVFQFSIEETNQYISTLCLPQLIKLSIRSRASAGQGASKTNALLQTNIWSPPLVYSYRFFHLLSATLPEVDHSSSVNFSREPTGVSRTVTTFYRARCGLAVFFCGFISQFNWSRNNKHSKNFLWCSRF